MKPSLLILVLCISPFFLFSQDTEGVEITKSDYQYHMQGSHSFNFGIGVPNQVATAFTTANLAGFETDGGATPVFMLKYEYGITQDIGAGIHFGYFTAKTPKTEAITNTVTTFINDLGIPVSEEICQALGAFCTTETTTETQESAYDRYHVYTPGIRLAYHRQVIEGLDTYASVFGGYNVIRKQRNGDENANLNPFGSIPTFAYVTAAGARYYFSPQFAIYGEVGYGALTLVNFGATYRIP